MGYIAYETGDTPYKAEADGFIYGGQVGFTYRVAEKIDIDLMYRYSAGANVTGDLDDINRVDGVGSAILGINYLY
jgi:phosphoribosylformimino-5-aminoimidazole carboxamide ribonucleotide (ProFAR) isomerase